MGGRDGVIIGLRGVDDNIVGGRVGNIVGAKVLDGSVVGNGDGFADIGFVDGEFDGGNVFFI